MTDRELLEKAAKAAGMSWRDWTPTDVSKEPNPALWPYMWNPLTDDGDALRLAVALCIALRCDDSAAASAGWSANQKGAPTTDGKGPWYWKEWIHNHEGDRYAATRRAIVRAAAAIGESMG